jgi:predicted DCC family thiol-disulfide oxidoreductase YuxK
MEMKVKAETYNKIIFYDGVCLLCNRFIKFVLKADRKKEIYIAPLQSDFAQSILAKHQISTEELDSVVFRIRGEVYTESDAALKIYKELGFPWSMAVVFWIVPTVIRNSVYKWVARNRYRWFGKAKDICEIPGAEFRDRIIRSI